MHFTLYPRAVHHIPHSSPSCPYYVPAHPWGSLWVITASDMETIPVFQLSCLSLLLPGTTNWPQQGLPKAWEGWLVLGKVHSWVVAEGNLEDNPDNQGLKEKHREKTKPLEEICDKKGALPRYLWKVGAASKLEKTLKKWQRFAVVAKAPYTDKPGLLHRRSCTGESIAVGRVRHAHEE